MSSSSYPQSQSDDDEDTWVDLKIGSTFLQDDDENNNSFHTISFDFLPLSIDQSAPGYIEFNNTNEVTVTLANIPGSSVDTRKRKIHTRSIELCNHSKAPKSFKQN
ncbi:hypothetical protein GJ496_003384 [Pomphorhynchus laevis]|nr:hypothetical protein GJ496_003384 [Pomphorhynchus laevis]